VIIIVMRDNISSSADSDHHQESVKVMFSLSKEPQRSEKVIGKRYHF
jgi:hypothetical protein